MKPVKPRKRVSGDLDTSASKRKPSPIRFESSAKDTAKKESATLYSPPKDKFSKKFANGSGFEDYVGGRRRGRGRGRSKGTWRV